MNASLFESTDVPHGMVPGANYVPVPVATDTRFAEQALAHLPLAESVLLLWQQVADAAYLQDLFEKYRGRSYDKILSFPSLVQLIADALLQHDGSARASFGRALEHDALDVSIPAAYGKLRRVPIPLSSAFLSEGTARLRALLPMRPTAAIPNSLQGLTVTVLDGKAIKRVAKRLKVLRGVPGGLLGGKTLVALELNTGLAVAMQAHPDGEINELRLLPDVVSEVRQRLPGPRLWVGDRRTATDTDRRFATAGDHFLVLPPQGAFPFGPAACGVLQHGWAAALTSRSGDGWGSDRPRRRLRPPHPRDAGGRHGTDFGDRLAERRSLSAGGSA